MPMTGRYYVYLSTKGGEKKESIGEPDEPKLERPEFWMVKISPSGRNDMDM